MSHVSSLIAAQIQKFFSSKVYYKIFFCMLTLLIQANSPVHAAGTVNNLHVEIMVITTWAQRRGWEQNIQLRSAVQISFLHREQKMWILPVHQKRAVFWNLLILKWHENTKGKKPFWCLIMRNMVDFQIWNYLTHTHTHTRQHTEKREWGREKYLKKHWNKMKKITYYSRHQIMDDIYFVSV